MDRLGRKNRHLPNSISIRGCRLDLISYGTIMNILDLDVEEDFLLQFHCCGSKGVSIGRVSQVCRLKRIHIEIYI